MVKCFDMKINKIILNPKEQDQRINIFIDNKTINLFKKSEYYNLKLA